MQDLRCKHWAYFPKTSEDRRISEITRLYSSTPPKGHGMKREAVSGHSALLQFTLSLLVALYMYKNP